MAIKRGTKMKPFITIELVVKAKKMRMSDSVKTIYFKAFRNVILIY